MEGSAHRGAFFLPSTLCRPLACDHFTNLLHAVFRRRMRAEEIRAPPATADLGEDLHHTDEFLRLIARLQHEAHAERIGFELVIAAELHHPPLCHHLGQMSSGVVLTIAQQDARSLRQTAPQPRACHLLVRVTAHDVPHLMTENTGELVFVLQAAEQGLGDENLAARQRKGIHRRAIRQQVKIKAIRRLPCRGGGQQPLPHGLHLRHCLRITRGAAHLADHLRGGLQPERDFLLRRGDGERLHAAGELVLILRRAQPVIHDRSHDHQQADHDSRIAAHTA